MTTLDPKALEAAKHCLGDAMAWGCEPQDALGSAITAYLEAAPSGQAPLAEGVAALLARYEAALAAHGPIAWLTRGIKDETRGQLQLTHEGGPENRLWWSEAFPVYAALLAQPIIAEPVAWAGDNFREHLAKTGGAYVRAERGVDYYLVPIYASPPTIGAVEAIGEGGLGTLTSAIEILSTVNEWLEQREDGRPTTNSERTIRDVVFHRLTWLEERVGLTLPAAPREGR